MEDDAEDDAELALDGDDALSSSISAVGCSRGGIDDADADETDGEFSCDVVNH